MSITPHADQTNEGAAQRDRERLAQTTAWAVRNNEGYWIGIWNDRETAERVKGEGQPSHGQQVVEVIIKEPCA